MTDGRLDVRKGPHGHKKPIFHIIRHSGEPGWSPPRGHPFCQNSDESAHANRRHGCPQGMDIERIPQSAHTSPTRTAAAQPPTLTISTPNPEGTKLMYTSVGLIIQWRKGPPGQIEDIPRFITFIRSQLKGDRAAPPHDRKTYHMIVGDYGGPLAFATKLPFCTAHPSSLADRDDPTRMTLRHPHNHPRSPHHRCSPGSSITGTR